ncbi:MAG: hypothetical protein HY234_00070 [Acidobacteria bacterium]|nr:hypothetical protein [Acidobacteriota bacterium]MBI3661436.1 hypothetical protein [Acidobacteriota bacterium]
MRRTGLMALALALLLVLSADEGLGLSGGSLLFAQSQEPQKKQDKQEKKTDSKKAKKSDQAPAPGDTADIAAERKSLTRVLRALTDAVEGSSPRRLRDLLDERFYDFPRFEDQVTDFLRDNAEIRMYLRESTAEVKGDKATLIVDADMTYALKATPTAQQKRRERIQFDFVRTAAGWKIYEITPRRFFTP